MRAGLLPVRYHVALCARWSVRLLQACLAVAVPDRYLRSNDFCARRTMRKTGRSATKQDQEKQERCVQYRPEHSVMVHIAVEGANSKEELGASCANALKPHVCLGLECWMDPGRHTVQASSRERGDGSPSYVVCSQSRQENMQTPGSACTQLAGGARRDQL